VVTGVTIKMGDVPVLAAFSMWADERIINRVWFVQKVIVCLGALFLCGCGLSVNTTNIAPVRVKISAGKLASVSGEELCVVELEKGKRRFIQAIPSQLSGFSPASTFSYIAYDSESHRIVVSLKCGWSRATTTLKGGGKAQPSSTSTTDYLRFPPNTTTFYLPVNGVRSSSLLFSIPLREDRSAEFALSVIDRLLDSGFKLRLNQWPDRKSRLLKLEGNERINDPALGSATRQGKIRPYVGTAGIDRPAFSSGLGCSTSNHGTVPLPLLTGTLTVPPMVGTSVPEDTKLIELPDSSIDKSSRFKIGA